MMRLLGAIGRGVALLACLAVFPFDLVVAQGTQGDPLSNLLAYGGALGTSALLGLSKKADTAITNSSFYRKLQPFITLGGAFLVPWVAAHTGVAVDPSAFAVAPTATVVTIGAVELLSLLTKRKPKG